MVEPLFQTGPLVFIAMTIGFALVLLGCSISDALRAESAAPDSCNRPAGRAIPALSCPARAAVLTTAPHAFESTIRHDRDMFGVRLTSLFTSRWMALAWAVLICLYAVQYVGAGRSGADGDSGADNSDDAAAVAAAQGASKEQVDAVIKAIN